MSKIKKKMYLLFLISYNNSKHHKCNVKNYFELFKLLVSPVIDLFSSFI